MKNIYIILFVLVSLYVIYRNFYHYEKLDNISDNLTLTNPYRNSTIPVFIISYNQYTFVKSTVEQLQKYSSNINIIDNKSTYPPLVEYLKSIENEVNVIYMDKNYGHKVYMRDEIVKLGGDKYIITDPDLLFNPKLPQNFIDILSTLSDQYKVGKIGFALDITNNINNNIIATDNNKTIVDWESQFWKNKIDHPEYEIYNADIDTTFVLINSKYYIPDSYSAIRVAGDFTCVHKPWVVGYENELLDGELNYYRNNNISSTWAS